MGAVGGGSQDPREGGVSAWIYTQEGVYTVLLLLFIPLLSRDCILVARWILSHYPLDGIYSSAPPPLPTPALPYKAHLTLLGPAGSLNMTPS